MREIWMNHLSAKTWSEPERWMELFKRAQEILGSKLTRLDSRDPVTKRVRTLDEAAAYICAFKDGEQSRRLYGKFEGAEIEFSIQHYRHIGNWPSSLTWHIPISALKQESGLARIKSIFEVGNAQLDAFYSFADDRLIVASKNRSTGSIDIREELLGVFWLTYFNARYVEFFGGEKLRELGSPDPFPVVEFDSSGAATVLLGPEPELVSAALRESCAVVLGRNSFVDVNDPSEKGVGRFALTFPELLGH